MDSAEIKELLKQFDESTLKEFDLKAGSFALYMNKNEFSQKVISSSIQEKKRETVNNEVMTKEIDETIENAAPVTSVKTENTEAIVSPIVGIVYLQPAPDKENFKQVGDAVKKGEVICIVEAMKLMNEITATVDGVISEILVKNEDVVEFNQPLFKVAKGE